MNTPVTSTTLADELNATPREQLVEMFLGLLAPTAEDFDGELRGVPAAYLGVEPEAYFRATGLGRWLGKGYVLEPYNDWAGHGYNLWGGDSGLVTRRMRFGWGFGASVLDGGPCLRMRYSAFRNAHGELELYDEIRKVDESVYLGVAMTTEPSPMCPLPGPDGHTLPSTFILVGPPTAWVGPDDAAAELDRE